MSLDPGWLRPPEESLAYLGLHVPRQHVRRSGGKIPTGVGLAIGAVASLGLWGGVALGVRALFF